MYYILHLICCFFSSTVFLPILGIHLYWVYVGIIAISENLIYVLTIYICKLVSQKQVKTTALSKFCFFLQKDIQLLSSNQIRTVFITPRTFFVVFSFSFFIMYVVTSGKAWWEIRDIEFKDDSENVSICND